MSKKLENIILFDIYSPLLTDKQRETLDLYYNEDLSLREIGDITGITRQGVMNCIKKAEERLGELEGGLELAARFKLLAEKTDKLEARLVNIGAFDDPEVSETLDEIKKLL